VREASDVFHLHTGRRRGDGRGWRWLARGGKIETDEGVLGDQAVAIIPLEILCM